MKDDSSKRTINILAKRAGHRCSTPECRQPTSGLHTDAAKAVNAGKAAYITAAAPGGLR